MFDKIYRRKLHEISTISKHIRMKKKIAETATLFTVSFSLTDKGLIRIMGRECPVSPLVYLCQSVKSNLSYNKQT
jgi:hypothetical protein